MLSRLPFLLAALLPAALAAQPAPRRAATTPATTPASGAFVILKGADTIGVERYERRSRRGGDSVTAILQLRQPALRIRHTLIDSAGTVPRYTTEATPAGGGASERGRFRFAGRQLTAQVGGKTRRATVQPGTLPWLNPSFVLVEQLVRRARQRSGGGASVVIPLFDVRADTPFLAQAQFRGRDSLIVRLPRAEMHVGLDSAGTVTGARVPAENVTVIRQP